MKAFQCDKCGEHFTRGRRALEKTISFDGPRGPRTLSVDLLYRCVHPKGQRGLGKYPADSSQEARAHQAHFCDDCLLWLLDEYKGNIMVAVGREEDVTTDAREPSNQA